MPSAEMTMAGLAGRRVLVLGTGREGSAIADAIVPLATTVTAYDDSDGPSAAAWRERWGGRAPLLVGAGADLDPASFDVVIASPGISKHHPVVRALRDAGLLITSGTALWMAEHHASTTGVTGSKGKSTTASLIQHLGLAFGGHVALGGNIGIPLLSLAPAERYVVELSSYQCSSLTVSPDVAVLTSLFPEHLDWHGSEQEYYRDKLNLIAHGPRVVVANSLDERLMRLLGELHPGVEVEPGGSAGSFHLVEHDGSVWIARRGEPLVERSRLALLGAHNALNACLALAAVEAAGIAVTADGETLRRAIESFRPLEHRLEPIADPSGLTFVNDSLSTSPYAAIEALKAFTGPAVTLIVGGQDRGVDYRPLADHLRAHPIAAVIGLPPSGERILGTIGSAVPSYLVGDLPAAVTTARAVTPAEGYVLLSPAAPSYGVYRDYADRAEQFKAAIRQTAPEPSETV